MRGWREGGLALVVAALLGFGLLLFTGESRGDPDPDPRAPISFDPEAAARGELLAEGEACLQCHTVDGRLGTTGPTWKALAGSSRPLVTGEFVTATDTYLFNSIVDPNSQVVQGYQPVMPDYFVDQLTEQQILDLVEYIKSLST